MSNLEIDSDNLNRHKQQISQAFSRASQSYNSVAQLQKQSAEKLASFLPETIKPMALDLGCGTGLNHHYIAAKATHCIAMDLALRMCQTMQQQSAVTTSVLQADAEQLPLQNQTIDYVFSNLMMQWLPNLQRLGQELKRILRQDGKIYCSTLLVGSLNELQMAWQQVDNDQHINHFFSLEKLIEQLQRSKINIDHYEQQNIQIPLDNPMQLIRDLKALGANTVLNRKQAIHTTRQQWQQFIAAYPKNEQEHYMISYKVGYFILS